MLTHTHTQPCSSLLFFSLCVLLHLLHTQHSSSSQKDSRAFQSISVPTELASELGAEADDSRRAGRFLGISFVESGSPLA